MKASIYNASAGSGKTYRLAYKYVRDLIEEPELYRQILAVTFTNKATEEMKRRILQQIHTLAIGGKSPYLEALVEELEMDEAKIRYRASRAQSKILHNYSRFTILTIDKFFQRVLRAFIQELGITIDYTLEIESSGVVDRSIDALIESIVHDPNLRAWLMSYVEERCSDGEKWDIRDGISSLAAKLFDEETRSALDCAPSREELRQIAIEQQRSSEAAQQRLKELASRATSIISSNGLSYDDFKGKSRSPVSIFGRVANGEIPEVKISHRKLLSDESEWCGAKSAARGVVAELQPLMSEMIDQIEATRRAVNTAKMIRENMRSYALLSDLYKHSEEICREHNTMLLNQTSRLIETFVSESDAPFIYEKIGNRYSRFMIDEFQDTSRREWQNFLPLLQNAISEAKPNTKCVLMVGDIKQSIYRWRGGDWRILHSDARRELGNNETEIVNMRDNYRSLPRIVQFAGDMIDEAVRIEERDLSESQSEAYNNNSISQECYNSLRGVITSAYEGHRQNPHRTDGEGFVEVVSYEDEQPPIIERICAAIDNGYRPCDIMMLCYTNNEACKIAEQLLAFKRSCPDPKYLFDVMTQQALTVGYAAVSGFIVSILKLSIDPTNTIQRAIYNQFLQRESVDSPIPEEEQKFLHSIARRAPIEAFEMLCEQYKLGSDPSDIAYIQAIHEQIIDFGSSRIGDIALWLTWWEESGHKRSLSIEQSERAIEVITIHKAKGLERPVVMIPYCNWSRDPRSGGRNRRYVWARNSDNPKPESPLFPVIYRGDMAQSAFADEFHHERLYAHMDSLNMLYVALTRAAESLHVFVPTKGDKAAGIGAVILEAMAKITLPEKPMVRNCGDEAEKNSTHKIITSYKSSQPNLKLSMPATKYRENGEIYTPREQGIMLHKIFEQSANRNDIADQLTTMRRNSQLSEAEYVELTTACDAALAKKLPAEWFSDTWDEVLTERGVLLPEGRGAMRPDRVMIKGARCVVVDYKFGELHSARYKRQLGRYMKLMREMGYTQVEGYLWYIRSGEIIEA